MGGPTLHKDVEATSQLSTFRAEQKCLAPASAKAPNLKGDLLAAGSLVSLLVSLFCLALGASGTLSHPSAYV